MTVCAISLYLLDNRLFRTKAEEGALKLVDTNQLTRGAELEVSVAFWRCHLSPDSGERGNFSNPVL